MKFLTTFLKGFFTAEKSAQTAVSGAGSRASEKAAAPAVSGGGSSPQPENAPADDGTQTIPRDAGMTQSQIDAEVDEWAAFANSMGEIVPKGLDVMEIHYEAPIFKTPDAPRQAQPDSTVDENPASEPEPSQQAEQNPIAPENPTPEPEPTQQAEPGQNPAEQNAPQRVGEGKADGQHLLPPFHQKRVAIAMLKGGVGKTTLTCFIATALQQIWERSKSNGRVLVVDSDPQGSATDFFLQDQIPPPEQTLRALFFPASRDAPIPSGNSKTLIHSTRYSRIDILPAHPSVADAEASSMIYPEERLARYLFDASEGYSLVLIDTPPSATLALKNAMMASSGVLVPVDPSRQSLKTLPLFSAALNEYKRRNARLTIYGIVFSRCDARTSLDKSIRKAVSKQLESSGIPLFEVPNRAAVASCYNNYLGSEGLDARKTSDAEICKIFYNMAQYVLDKH